MDHQIQVCKSKIYRNMVFVDSLLNEIGSFELLPNSNLWNNKCNLQRHVCCKHNAVTDSCDLEIDFLFSNIKRKDEHSICNWKWNWSNKHLLVNALSHFEFFVHSLVSSFHILVLLFDLLFQTHLDDVLRFFICLQYSIFIIFFKNFNQIIKFPKLVQEDRKPKRICYIDQAKNSFLNPIKNKQNMLTIIAELKINMVELVFAFWEELISH